MDIYIDCSGVRDRGGLFLFFFLWFGGQVVLKEKICIDAQGAEECAQDGCFREADACFIVGDGVGGHAYQRSQLAAGHAALFTGLFDAVADIHIFHGSIPYSCKASSPPTLYPLAYPSS